MPKANKRSRSPQILECLKKLGQQIRLARLRRNFSMVTVAERAGINPISIYRMEHGYPGTTIAMYAAALSVLTGLENDLLLIAKEDAFGRELQDIKLIGKRIRASRK